MIVNLIVILFILLLGFHFSRRKNANSNKIKARYITIISIILILQSGLRNVAVGADTYGYKISFETQQFIKWNDVKETFFNYYKLGEGKDPGFTVIEKISYSLSNNYNVYLLLIALFFFSALGSFIFDNTKRLKDIVISYLIYSVLFYSFFSITGHRQTIATAFTLFSFKFLKQRKIIPFLLLILMGSTIHKSCLIFLLYYFACKINKPKYIFTFAILLFPILMIFRSTLLGYSQLIGGYEEYEEYEGAGTLTFTLMFLLLSLVALFHHKYIISQNSDNHFNYIAFAFAIVFLPLTWINPSMMRVVQYFSIFMLLFVPEILRSFQIYSIDIYNRVRSLSIIILIILFFKSSWNSPTYGFFWEDIKLGKNYE